MAGQFEGLPPTDKVAQRINSLRAGDINSTQQFTLAANASSTALLDPNLLPSKVVLFDPMTQNAAVELYGGSMFVTAANRGVGSWTITHANSSLSDRTFFALIIGG